MISPPPIADLTRISAAGAALERAVQRWIDESTLGRYTLNVPTIVEFVDFYTRLLAARKTIIKLSRLCGFECSNSQLATRNSPLDTPFDDLAPLHAVGAELERVVMGWALDIERCPDPDVPTIAEAVDIVTRLASARKTLIKLSQPTPRAKAGSGGKTSASPDPSPAINIPQLPTISGTPYDHIAPEYDFITAALDHINPDILKEPQPSPDEPSTTSPETVGPENVGPAPSPAIQETPSPAIQETPSPAIQGPPSPAIQDPPSPAIQETPSADVSHTSHSSHSSHDSHSSQTSPHSPLTTPHSPLATPPIPLDCRCVALNIHPMADTSRFPNNHPWFDRSMLGHFNPRFLSAWNRKKFRRYG